MKPDVGHIRTFGCVVRVTPPSETLGKLEDRGAMMEHVRGRLSRLDPPDRSEEK
jgi:hypothetical protein